MAYAFECFAGRSVCSQQSHAPIQRRHRVVSRRGTALRTLAFVPEPLEDRRPASGMISATAVDAVVLGTPDSASELVAELSGDTNQQAAAPAPSAGGPRLDLSARPLAPEDDPLSAAGDPTKGTRAKRPVATTLDEGSSSSSEGVYVFASVTPVNGSIVDEETPAVPGYFHFSVYSTCFGSQDWPTSATLNWGLGGDATPTDDYNGQLLDGTVTIGLSGGAGSIDIPFSAVDDQIDEGDESVVVTLGGFTTCGGTVLDHTVTDPIATGMVADNDYKATYTQAGDSEPTDTITLSSTASSTTPPHSRQVTVKVVQGNSAFRNRTIRGVVGSRVQLSGNESSGVQTDNDGKYTFTITAKTGGTQIEEDSLKVEVQDGGWKLAKGELKILISP